MADRPAQSAGSVAAVYDQLAEGYEKGFTGNEIAWSARERTRAWYRPWLTLDTRAADLGCGPGIDTFWLAEHTKQVWAVDCSPRMIETLRRASRLQAFGARVEASVGDVFSIENPLDGEPFDCIVMGFGVLNYVDDLRQALESVRRILRPGGILLVSVLTRRCLWDMVWHRIVLRSRPVRWSTGLSQFTLGGAACYERYWTLGDFRRALPNGMEIADWQAMGHLAPPPYLDAHFSRMPLVKRLLLRLDALTQRSWLAKTVSDVLWVAIRD